MGWMVCDTKMNSTVQFNRVDFADGSATKMEARIACGQRVGHFEVRIGNEKGKLIAKFPIEYTGGWSTWKTIETPLLEKVTGSQNIVVVFVSDWGSTKAVNLNWLKLIK